MKVDYINVDITDACARCTFIGHDAKGRRRPVIELDTSDLRRLIEVAADFRRRQRALAQKYKSRADDLTCSGLCELVEF